jgi:hypothetical protein
MPRQSPNKTEINHDTRRKTHDRQSVGGYFLDPREHDERPRDPIPSDEELNAMYESYEEKRQSESEAYRLAH